MFSIIRTKNTPLYTQPPRSDIRHVDNPNLSEKENEDIRKAKHISDLNFSKSHSIRTGDSAKMSEDDL